MMAAAMGKATRGVELAVLLFQCQALRLELLRLAAQRAVGRAQLVLLRLQLFGLRLQAACLFLLDLLFGKQVWDAVGIAVNHFL